jgi:xanthine dehydrogenase YagS FAD-binding subunit
MKNFEYAPARDVKQALSLLTGDWAQARVMGGGTDLLDEMKERLAETNRIVHLQNAPLSTIKSTSSQLLIGATATLATLESHALIKQRLPGLAQAAASIGTPQIRNAGTIGGNLCQRPRCWYYRNSEFPCLKKGGSTCYAKDGANKYNSILGGGPSYIVHPSDLAPMLIALNASVRIANPKGERMVPLEKFFVSPKQNVERENILEPNEIVTEIVIPLPVAGAKSTYLKFKERETQDFAIASAAVAMNLKNGVVQNCRVVLGGVAPIPWRSLEAEKVLVGQKPTLQLAQKAADAALKPAKPLRDNAYKVPIATAMVRRAIMAVI